MNTLNDGKYKSADIGTVEFDELTRDDLLLDMEKRFQNAEIRGYD